MSPVLLACSWQHRSTIQCVGLARGLIAGYWRGELCLVAYSAASNIGHQSLLPPQWHSIRPPPGGETPLSLGRPGHIHDQIKSKLGAPAGRRAVHTGFSFKDAIGHVLCPHQGQYEKATYDCSALLFEGSDSLQAPIFLVAVLLKEWRKGQY